jgi:hypothetical protein
MLGPQRVIIKLNIGEIFKKLKEKGKRLKRKNWNSMGSNAGSINKRKLKAGV